MTGEGLDDRAAHALVEQVTGAPGFTSGIGTRVLAARAGQVELALDRRPDLLQANGFFHGGVIAGLADHAAGGAVTTALAPGRFAVTVSLQVTYLAPATGETLIARARAIQAGRTIGTAQVELSTLAGGVETPCAIATVSLRAVDMPARRAGTA
ncbi:MAG: PaaI family thioesterase [Sneathiellaceae bacterium]